MPVPFKRLTKTQMNYLRVIQAQEHLKQGWGGYSSTQTVRILEERGLIRLRRWPEYWEASITGAGRICLKRFGFEL